MEATQKIPVSTEPKKPNKLQRKFNKAYVGQRLSNGLCHVILIGIVFLILFPFIEKICTMLLAYEDLADSTVRYVPKTWSLNTLVRTMGIMKYWQTLGTTTLLCILTSGLQTLSCTLVAYGFARFKFPGRGILFAGVLMILLIPPQVIMTSLYMKFTFFNFLGIPKLIAGTTIDITEGMWPFVLLSATAIAFKNSLYIYMLRQFFRGLPTEIEEAGMIDGSGHFGVFFRLMLPNAVPMMVTIILFSFSWQWTDNYYSALFLQRSKLISVLSLKLNELQTYGQGQEYYTGNFRQAMIGTGVLLVIAPLVIIYLFGQKFFVQGISQSGIVG
ncbi:MAG: carbohydrate ABC transporter permease [Clostridia bacterium]|nr:carbohydrate ABC transporter permease [Clostridia bacterium]